MNVYEIFRSLQGETSRVGLPMDFVRLAGCDLACSYCDTPEARDASAGRDMSVAEVLAALPAPPLEWVMITGGEPLLQVDAVNALVDALHAGGRPSLVETSGAHPTDTLDPRAIRILDWKTPGSGMAERMCRENLGRLRPEDEVKFVLTGRSDYEWARQITADERLVERATVLFGPARPHLDEKTLAGWLASDALTVRLNVQLHKWLGFR